LNPGVGLAGDLLHALGNFGSERARPRRPQRSGAKAMEKTSSGDRHRADALLKRRLERTKGRAPRHRSAAPSPIHGVSRYWLLGMVGKLTNSFRAVASRCGTWVKSNMLSIGPAMVSNDAPGWTRCPCSQLSSMKRSTELWSVRV